MQLSDCSLYHSYRTALLDQVGADGTTIICIIMAALLRDGNSIFLISYTDTLSKFKQLLRKLSVPDLTLLEAQGRFKFSQTYCASIDEKYTLIIHSGSFAVEKDILSSLKRKNIVVHLHKDLDEKIWKFAIRNSNLVLDLQPLQSGFSDQIFGKLVAFPGGLFHEKVSGMSHWSVSATETSVSLVNLPQK
jgi:hypothetical protein